MRGGKNAMAKLESRIRELEIELGNVQAHTGENMKAHQKAERKIKELQFQNDEDKKNQDRMSKLTKRLSVRSRSSSSKMMRTRRTRTVCLSLPPSFSRRSRPTRSRLKKPRRLLHLILPSFARPSKSLRRPRTAPSLLKVLSMLLSKQKKNND